MTSVIFRFLPCVPPSFGNGVEPRSVIEFIGDGQKVKGLYITRDEGAGTALNRIVYNRDLASVLGAAVTAMAVYGFWLRGSGQGGFRVILLLVLVFAPVFWFLQRVVFRERHTSVVLDGDRRELIVARALLLREKTHRFPLADWGFVTVDERLPRGADDLKDIYRWQQMAEPGVHAEAVPVYRVLVVGKDGRELCLVHESLDMDEALEVKRLLTELRAEFA